MVRDPDLLSLPDRWLPKQGIVQQHLKSSEKKGGQYEVKEFKCSSSPIPSITEKNTALE